MKKRKEKKSGFSLGSRSKKNLQGVHPDLVKVVKRAIEITEEDFMVGCGTRTRAMQMQLVAKGASKTMNSKHLRQADGYSHAVDLWVWKDGKISWDTSNAYSFYELTHDDDYTLYQEIGTSMIKAAKELGVKIRWGADWDMDGQHTDHSFIDWVHFQLDMS